ncbi:MAG: nuclear transport factor 2 family protein [Nocardioides sp.]
MTMVDAEERVADLERRLARLEDEQAIARLIASYGPLVDSGQAGAVGQLWHEDGVYDVDGMRMEGRDEIEAMVESDAHQGLTRGGCLHFSGPPAVRVEGDDAVAVCHSLLVLHRDGRFRVFRAGANRWRLRREGGKWRATERTTRALDGRTEARELFAQEP